MTNRDHSLEYWAGAALGDDTLIVGVYDHALLRLGQAKLSPKPARGPEAVIGRLVRAFGYAVDEADLNAEDVRGLGVSLPGAGALAAGKPAGAPPGGWHRLAVQARLEAELNLPVLVEAEGNLAALGVYEAELESKPSRLLVLLVGADVSGGLLVDGTIAKDARCPPVEAGHWILKADGPDCFCGQRGCLQTLVSRSALFGQIRAALQQGEPSVLKTILGGDLGQLKFAHVRKALGQGDALVQRLVAQTGRYIGQALARLVEAHQPEVVVLGGTVMEKLADDLLGVILTTARESAPAGAMDKVVVQVSDLGDKALLAGGAALARRSLSRRRDLPRAPEPGSRLGAIPPALPGLTGAAPPPAGGGGTASRLQAWV